MSLLYAYNAKSTNNSAFSLRDKSNSNIGFNQLNPPRTTVTLKKRVKASHIPKQQVIEKKYDHQHRDDKGKLISLANINYYDLQPRSPTKASGQEHEVFEEDNALERKDTVDVQPDIPDSESKEKKEKSQETATTATLTEVEKEEEKPPKEEEKPPKEEEKPPKEVEKPPKEEEKPKEVEKKPSNPDKSSSSKRHKHSIRKEQQIENDKLKTDSTSSKMKQSPKKPPIREKENIVKVSGGGGEGDDSKKSSSHKNHLRNNKPPAPTTTTKDDEDNRKNNRKRNNLPSIFPAKSKKGQTTTTTNEIPSYCASDDSFMKFEPNLFKKLLNEREDVIRAKKKIPTNYQWKVFNDIPYSEHGDLLERFHMPLAAYVIVLT